MTTTTVPNGTTVNNQDVTTGNVLDVLSGGNAVSTTVESGGSQIVEAGATESGAIINAGGTETVNGTINASNVPTSSGSSTNDDISGTVNVGSGGTITSAIIENGGILNLTAKSASADTIIVKTGGLLAINGNAPANNVTLEGGTFELQSPKADSVNTVTGVPSASGMLTFADGSSSRLQLDVVQTGTNGTTFSQQIAGFASGDVVNLKAITNGTISGTSTQGDVTTVTVTGTGGSETFNFISTPAASFAVATDTNGGTNLISTACYMSGTLIATTRGEVAVEDLAIGDEVVTAAGARRPIRWIGHRAYLPRFANANPALLPILFTAGSLGHGLPRRDLLVSPKHAMFIDGVLVPAECLVDGRGIRKLDHVETLTYWHIELDSHDVLLAEGTPSESFVDDNSRNLFHNAQSYRDANPDAVATEAVYCAPRVEDGFALAAIRAGIAERAGRAAPATCGGAFEGAFAVEGGMVKGWARNAFFPAAAVCLDIVVDGTVVAQTLADRFQPAVGAHGFAAALPATAGTVTVRRSLDGAALKAETRVAAAA